MPFLLRGGGGGDMWETDGNMRGDVSTCISKFEFSGDEILGLHLMRELTVREILFTLQLPFNSRFYIVSTIYDSFVSSNAACNKVYDPDHVY